MTEPVEARYRREEQELVDQRRRTRLRGPVGLIAVCLVVDVAVAAITVVDLRRLHTPRGAALAWTGAVLFGDCTAFRRLTAGPQGDAVVQCRDLRARTAVDRDRSRDVDFRVLQVQQTGSTARVVVRVRRPDQPDADVPLVLVRDGSRWQVERTAQACAVLPCPGPVAG